MADDATPEASTAALQTSVSYRVVTLLELIAQRAGGVGVREAARETGIDRSAVSRLFLQLEQLGCVVQAAERGQYAAGPRLFAIAAALRGRDELWSAARPIIEEVVAKHNEACYLTVRTGGSVVFRDKVDCTHRIRYVVELGTPFPLASGAAGRAILSGLPEDEAGAIVARGLTAYTDASITDPNTYLRQLRDDRRLGCSVSFGSWVKNGAGVASPFFDATGTCIGALTLSCPADRLGPSLLPEVLDTMRAASQQLSRRLGWSHPWGADTVDSGGASLHRPSPDGADS